MNKKIKLFVGLILSIATLVGFFAVTNPTSAMTCNSATLTGTVNTGTPPTHARFSYATNYNTVSNGQGTTTAVQYFNTEGTFPIEQYVDGLTENTTYYFRLEVTNNYGTSNLNIQNFTTPACPVTIPAPTVSIYTSPSSIAYNGTSTITWSSTNATSCSASGDWSGTKTTSGSQSTGNLTSSKTYTLTCTNSTGSASNSATVSVSQALVPTVSLTANPSNIQYGGSSTLSWSSTNATSCSASWANSVATSGYKTVYPTSSTTYSVTCTGQGGNASDSAIVTVASKPVLSPTASLSASSTNLTYGGSTYLTWSSTNATSCVGTNFNTNNATSGNIYTGALYNTTTYNITCTGSTGLSAYASVTVNVSGQLITSGTIAVNPSSCVIASGKSSCTTTLSWTTTNPEGVSSVTSSYPSANTIIATQNSGSQLVSIPYSSRTFFLYNNNSLLGQANATSSCASGTSWNGNACAVSSSLSPTVTLTADSNNIAYGASTYLHWTTTGNPTSCVANGGTDIWPGNKNTTSGSFYTGTLYNTTTYNITCSNTSGSSSDSVIVNVQNQPANSPTVSLTADSTNIAYGASTNLHWTTTGNPTSCIANGGSGNWSGNKSTSGGSSGTGALYSTTSYSITCSNSSGSYSDSVTITVGNQSVNNSTASLSASSTNLTYGGSTYLTWSSTNATSCVGTNFNTNNLSAGSVYTGALYNTTTYNITCTGSTGLSASNSVTVSVNGQQNYSNPTVNTNSPTNVNTYSATLNGYVSSNGSTSVNAWFQWGIGSSYGNQTSQISYGTTSGTSYTYYLSGLASNTTYYYEAVAQSSNGTLIYGSPMSFTTTSSYNGCTYNCYTYTNQPTVTTYSATNISNNYATLNGYVNSNGSYATAWFAWGTSYGSLYTTTNQTSQGSYGGNFSSSIYNLSPNITYYYQAVAQGNNGQLVYGNVLSFTTTGNTVYYNNVVYNNNTAPTAVSTMATNIGDSNVTLGGLGLVNNSVSTTGYFEYGATQSLGSTTTSQNIGSAQSDPFFQNLSTLASNTTYYYRAVVTNQYGTSRGDILSFTTLGSTASANTTRTIYKNTTVVSNTNNPSGNTKSSLVSLTITPDNQTITKGDTVEYVVNYKNVSSKNLKDIVLQILIPKELSFVEASRGTFSSLNSILVADIGPLNPQEEGSVNVRVKVTNDAITGKINVVTANLAYTVVSNNNQEEVFAYAKNTVADAGTVQLGALAFLFGNGFLPNSLIGWLLIVLLITLVVLAVRKAYHAQPRTIASESSKKTVK